MPKHRIIKDPDCLAGHIGLKRPAPDLKLALGLDLGTTTGYACAWFDPTRGWRPGERPLFLGQLDLSVGDYDSGAIRFVRLRNFLAAFDADVVFFEDVHGGGQAVKGFGPHPTVAQVVARVARPIELLGSYKCVVGMYCEDRNVPCKGYAIQAIKKRATGNGNANKEAVILAAAAEFDVDLVVEDYDKTGVDNIADALYVLVLGLEQYALGVPTAGRDDGTTRAIVRKRPAAARPPEEMTDAD